MLLAGVLNDRQHYLLFALALAMQPRLLITLTQDDNNPDNLKQVNVSVRVGQAVDVVAQAGKPKTITGFQTHTTPVLLSHGERAELANDECKDAVCQEQSSASLASAGFYLFCILFCGTQAEGEESNNKNVVIGLAFLSKVACI